MSKIKIFVSYSHKDEHWKNILNASLAPLRRLENVDIWEDRQVAAGSDWLKEVESYINAADIAILLISSDFLVSDFIVEAEIPHLLKRRENEGLVVLPIIVRPCIWQSVGWLASLNVFPGNGIPISMHDNLDEVMTTFARHVKEIIGILKLQKDDTNTENGVGSLLAKVSKVSDKSRPESNISANASVFISHSHDDGDFAEVLKLQLEKHDIDAWIDIDRLKVGYDWRQEIDDAIKKAIALIVVMSPLARESEYVTYEWAFAWGANVKVIPVMLKPTQIHPRLEALQHLDFTNRRARPWNDLINELIIDQKNS